MPQNARTTLLREFIIHRKNWKHVRGNHCYIRCTSSSAENHASFTQHLWFFSDKHLQNLEEKGSCYRTHITTPIFILKIRKHIPLTLKLNYSLAWITRGCILLLLCAKIPLMQSQLIRKYHTNPKKFPSPTCTFSRNICTAFFILKIRNNFFKLFKINFFPFSKFSRHFHIFFFWDSCLNHSKFWSYRYENETKMRNHR